MTVRFAQLRADVAAEVQSLLGINVVSVWDGNPEPDRGIVRWGSETGEWIRQDENSTFRAPAVHLTVVLTANALDTQGAQLLLEDRVADLMQSLGGRALTNGGRCPPVMSVSEPAPLAEDAGLLAVACHLAPFYLDITT